MSIEVVSETNPQPGEYPGTHLTSVPQIDPTAWIAPSAELMGEVVIGARSSVWFQCVLRADIERIVVGEESNIQDGTIVHMASDIPTIVGDRVCVGHGAILHACTIEDEVLIGMRATIMDGAVVGKGSIIGAGSLVTKGMKVPAGSLVLGSPAKVIRETTEEERSSIPTLAAKYVALAQQHRLDE